MSKSEVSNEDIMTMLSQFADNVNERFDAVDKRFDVVDKRLFRLENDVSEVKQKIVDLEASYDKILSA